MSLKVIKTRITPQNIGLFYIIDHRLNDDDFIQDRKVLEDKIINYERGITNELTKQYPERYDLNVLTYSQDKEPYLINDGCHRIEALRRIFDRGDIDGFNVWLIPSNIIGANTKEEALELNKKVKKELDKAGLPHWVLKFDYELVDGKLFAWKNLNLIDTGGKDTRRQYGVNWFLNEDPRRKLIDVDEHNYKNKYKL